MRKKNINLKSSATISSLVVFKSLSYNSLFKYAVQKLSPKMKESYSILTVQKHWKKPTILDFNGKSKGRGTWPDETNINERPELTKTPIQ